LVRRGAWPFFASCIALLAFCREHRQQAAIMRSGKLVTFETSAAILDKARGQVWPA
jgi:hypothetical protein